MIVISYWQHLTLSLDHCSESRTDGEDHHSRPMPRLPPLPPIFCCLAGLRFLKHRVPHHSWEWNCAEPSTSPQGFPVQTGGAFIKVIYLAVTEKNMRACLECSIQPSKSCWCCTVTFDIHCLPHALNGLLKVGANWSISLSGETLGGLQLR